MRRARLPARLRRPRRPDALRSAQRGARRLLGRVVGHCSQARTIRSSGSARMVAATLFACARLLYGFALSTKTTPARNHT